MTDDQKETLKNEVMGKVGAALNAKQKQSIGEGSIGDYNKARIDVLAFVKNAFPVLTDKDKSE